MSFLLNYLRGEEEVVKETLSLPGSAGLQVAFSRFAGYSPVLDGSIHTSVADHIDSTSSEKSSGIIVTITVRASHPSYKSNIRIIHLNNSLTLSTGGLSLAASLALPRLTIDVAISLPSTIGPLSINSPSLPIHIYSISKAGDVVIKSSSSHISVAAVEARSLTVSNQSGSITFEGGSEQVVDTAIDVSNSSGGTRLSSAMIAPVVSAKSSSGSVQLDFATTAGEIAVRDSSGGISGQVHYKKEGSISRYENSSGHINVTLRGWTGFLTAKTSSGGCRVKGLERWNEGWRKGKGDATATFVTQSGGLQIEAL